MMRYWSDDAYHQFYQNSAAERNLVNKPGAAAANGGISPKQLERFQEAFAEWSGGRGWLASADFRPFLSQVGVQLSAEQARCLWSEWKETHEKAQRMSYDEALQAYVQVQEAPIAFRRPTGAAPPGATLSEAATDDWLRSQVTAVGSSSAFVTAPLGEVGFIPPSSNQRRSCAGAACGNAAVPRCSGLSLQVADAEQFLVDEGLPRAAIDGFLADFRQFGSVNQSSIFDFLANWSEGACEQSGVYPLESSPSVSHPAPIHADGQQPLPTGGVPARQRRSGSRGRNLASARDGLGEYMSRRVAVKA